MAKQKGAPSVQNRHIYSRASYLYQAAQYLATHCDESTTKTPANLDEGQHSAAVKAGLEDRAKQNLSRQMITDMRGVTQKLLIRQSPDLKRSICKFCNTLQIEGQTSSSTVENLSKGGKKPWADTLVILCNTCGHKKRIPVSASRQPRRPFRPVAESKQEPAANEDAEMTVDDVT